MMIQKIKVLVRKIRRIRAYRLMNKAEISSLNRYYSNMELFYRRKFALCSHALEKGAGIRNSRKSYGKNKANELVEVLDLYLEKEFNVECWEFNEAINVLHFYIELQKSNGIEINDIEKRYQDIINKLSIISFSSNTKAGVKMVTSNELVPNIKEREALQLAIKKRRCVRYFSKEAIDEKTILEILQLAQYSPTACNRQPNRAYFTTDKDKINEIDMCVPGNNSFKGEVPYYFVITADRFAFEDEELFQWYVNGGIYIGFLSLVLHSFGLGGIIFQWPNRCKNENTIRSIVPIPDNETIVALIGFGKMDSNVKILEADRRLFDYYYKFRLCQNSVTRMT